jgi:hypothetical protein
VAMSQPEKAQTTKATVAMAAAATKT